MSITFKCVLMEFTNEFLLMEFTHIKLKTSQKHPSVVGSK